MELTFFKGFATSAALIIAIGAQNAFVLRQGLKREHVLVVVLVCALSDCQVAGSPSRLFAHHRNQKHRRRYTIQDLPSVAHEVDGEDRIE